MGRTEWIATGVALLAGGLFGVALGKRYLAKSLARMRQTRITPDGWYVPQPFWFYVRFIAEHQPPRPAFWFQLRIDATSPVPIAWWLVALNSIAFGADKRWWGLAAFGVFLFIAYLLMLWCAVLNLRNTPAAVGVIDSPLKPYRRTKHASTATAVTPDGQKVQIGVVNSLVSEIINRGERAQVLFLNNPQSQPCAVLAARALPSRPPELESHAVA